jgi:hypothetical protein
MEDEELIGKTIVSVKRKKHENDTDDDAWLELGFSDGTKTLIVASYGGYTGRSLDEYPAYIYLSDDYEDLIDA